MTVSNSKDNLVPNEFSVGMQNSALVLHDEEGGSVTELDELSSVSEQSNSPTAINIENSKDVIIGPVTQFHGPVTIYQNVNGNPAIENTPEKNECYQNGRLVKSESSASDGSHAAEKPAKNSLFHFKHLIYIGTPLILIVIVIIIACAIVLSNKPEGSPEFGNDHGHSDFSNDDGSLKPIGRGSFITREKWGGHAPLNFTKPLEHPTSLVVISHTGTPSCKNFVECSKRVLSIQDYQIGTLNFPDIGYNFLIGSDANIYVGRGWDVKNVHSVNSIGICFIGNYIYDFLTDDMITTAKSLIDEGVEKGKLSEDYKIICHNQTYATQSPGPHVYEVVKKWPHFDPSSYIKST